MAEAVQVAWGLITTIPPRIATCEPKDYIDEDLHELVGTGIPPEDGKYKHYEEGGSNMIHQWLEMEGATWQILATALADVGEEESAEKVNNKYCKVSWNSV